MTDNNCTRCDGGGRIANSDQGEPWSVWESLPPGSDLAVRCGVVQPITCPDCDGTGRRALAAEADPQPEGQAPVTGYTKQADKNVEIVNAIKAMENDVGTLVGKIHDRAITEPDGPDARMIAIARTNLQQGFMWLVRSVFQPESKL